MPNELLTVLAILQCALVICLPPGSPSTLTTSSLSTPSSSFSSSSSSSSFTQFPYHNIHHSTLPLHQQPLYPLLHQRSYWPPPFSPDHRLLQRIHLLRNLNELRYLEQLQNQLHYSFAVAESSPQSISPQYVLHQRPVQHSLSTSYPSTQTVLNQVNRVQIPQQHSTHHLLSSSSHSSTSASSSAISDYADNALQPLVPLAPSAITAIAFTPTNPLLTGSAKSHQTTSESETSSKSSVKPLKSSLLIGSKPRKSGVPSRFSVHNSSAVTPFISTSDSTKATVHPSFTRWSPSKTLSRVDVSTGNQTSPSLTDRSSSQVTSLVAGNELLNHESTDNSQLVRMQTDRLKLTPLSPTALYLNLFQQSLLDSRLLDTTASTQQQVLQHNRFVYDVVGTNRSLPKSLSGRKTLHLAERTAPDTSAGMFTRALGTLSQYLPNSMRIGRTSGCVGGTKCQFFLSCWISSGSLGSSCGPLSTCCITPSKQDIQPAFYGPVINDPHCGRSAARISRIVGGSDASFGQFPWQAFVQVGGSRCGGALVGQKHVVTAGHCVARSQHNPSDIRVTLGDYILNSDIESLPHELFSVAEVRLHPNFRFTPQADRYDVAILVLDRQVQYRNNIKPICLPQKDANFLGRVAYVAGWGALQAGSKLRPKVLQHVNVPVIDNNVCELWHRKRGINIKIHDEMMCAGYEFGGRDACQGDSGGPLMLNEYGVWYLIGIVSAGYSCAKQYQPGIYHRVSSSSDWVSANIYQNAN